jgi:5-formyltetrahydrofolate cyclo-ligase
MQRLYRHSRFMAAQTIMLYSALPDEPATLPLLNVLRAEGRTVLLPRVTSDSEMELRHYSGSADLEQGAFGIMEPTGAIFTDYKKIEVVVVPGMAFDEAGHRLGRGKGYYDRFLSLVPEAYKIGVCLPSHLVDHVPTDDHDILMDTVIT